MIPIEPIVAPNIEKTLTLSDPATTKRRKAMQADDAAFSWEWEHVDISHAGDVAWLFAADQVVLSTAQGQRKAPYRITGVLGRDGPRWLWRQYHGSEPAAGA
jgi:hypothetical protein